VRVGWDSSVSIVTRYGLDGRGSNSGEVGILTTVSNRLWCPPNIPCNRCQVIPGRNAVCEVRTVPLVPGPSYSVIG